MDGDSDWADTGLFSPSKAKAHQAQAKDWAFVDSWLAKRSARRVPVFERNEDTLEALLRLATINDAADEQRVAIDRVERAALSAQTKRLEADPEGLHELLAKHINISALDVLAEVSVSVDSTQRSISEVGAALVVLQDELFCSQQQHRTAETQLHALQAEGLRLQALLASVRSDSFQPSADIVEQGSEWVRSSKHLRAKIGEYDDRLAVTRSQMEPTITLDVLGKLTNDLEERHTRLERLKSEVTAFKSLPNNMQGARSKLETARDELRGFAEERDRMFERLAAS